MDASFVGKGVATDDRLVGLYRYSSNFAEQLACWIKLVTHHRGIEGMEIGTNPHGHDDFFEGSVAGTLANAIDGALHLTRSGRHGCQGIGYGKTQIIVAVGGNHDILDSPYSAADGLDQFAEFGRHGVADGVGNIERGGASLDYGFEHLAEKFGIGAGCVFGRKFHVIAEGFCPAHSVVGLLQTLLAGNSELVFQMNVRGCEEYVDARVCRVLECLPGSFDVGRTGAGQTGNYGTGKGRSDGLYCLKISIRGDGESGFDGIHAQAVEMAGEAQLFLHIHAATGRLLAVSQSGVEHLYSSSFHLAGPPGR